MAAFFTCDVAHNTAESFGPREELQLNADKRRKELEMLRNVAPPAAAGVAHRKLTDALATRIEVVEQAAGLADPRSRLDPRPTDPDAWSAVDAATGGRITKLATGDVESLKLPCRA